MDILTPSHRDHAIACLREQEPIFDDIVNRWGMPSSKSREPGFASLMHMILEQQVSLASALAVFNRLVTLTGTLTPQHFAELDDHQLSAIGFSRQKILYGRALADAIVTGDCPLDKLTTLPDEAVRAALMAIKGIGRWTADIYLIMVLQRTDVWPLGDLALAVSYQEVCGLTERPSQEGLADKALRWQPYRSTAALLLWHQYLSRRKKQYPQ